jgi:hypothetical protein
MDEKGGRRVASFRPATVGLVALFGTFTFGALNAHGGRTEAATPSSRLIATHRFVGAPELAPRAVALQISKFSATPGRLSSSGGRVELLAQTDGAQICVFTSAKPHLSKRVPCLSGSRRILVSLPANPSASSLAYRFDLSVINGASMKRRSLVVIEAGKPAPPAAPQPSAPPPPPGISSTATAPTVTLQPSNEAVQGGATVTFTAAATGTPQPSVEWRASTDDGADWTVVGGATATSYAFTASTSENGDEFDAVFANSAGTATTVAATLTVDLGITEQPESAAVLENTTAWFTAAATGTPTPSIQWQVSTDNGTTWQQVEGQTSSCYSFQAAPADDGEEVEAVFTNASGSATTADAVLTVLENSAAESTNWSGYAVTDPCGTSTFDDVSASWTVPSVSCTGVTTDQYSSAWVGIDGFSSSTVEQDGTDSDCIGSTPQYDAWYEMYGDADYHGGAQVVLNSTSYPVSPGDEISASVTVSGDEWTLSLSDSRWNEPFTTTIDFAGASASSAEWIVERPETCSNCAFPGLADFGTVTFTAAQAATEGGSLEPLTDYSATSLDIVNNAGTSVLDEVDSPTDSEDSFAVTWQSAGP